jgi:hypothetical protein
MQKITKEYQRLDDIKHEKELLLETRRTMKIEIQQNRDEIEKKLDLMKKGKLKPEDVLNQSKTNNS